MDKPVAVFIPLEPEIDYATLDYDQQIQYTQRIKSRVLHKLSTSQVDGGVPTDKDSVELLLKVADSMDRTTLTNKRNAVDENNGDVNAEILRTLSALALSNGNNNPLMSKTAVVDRSNEPEIPLEDLGEFTHNDGIAFVGVENETVEAFTKRMAPLADAARRAEEEELGIK